MPNYSSQYMKHFTAPQNSGEVENPDAAAEVKHEGGGCLDQVRMTLKVEDGKISELKYRLRACSGTIAACSGITSIASGKTLEEAAKLGTEELLAELGGVPERKMHSVELAVKALQRTIADYNEGKSE